MPFLTLLFSKAGMIAMAVIAAIAVGAFWLHSHDNAVRAAMQADANKAIAAAQAADAEHEKVAVAAVASDATKRAVIYTTIKETTHAAPVTSACANSPAVSALLDGLRHSNGSGAPAPGRPVASKLPGSTGPAGKPAH
jgi:hypothetical protein